MKKEQGYRTLIFLIWASLLVLSIVITFKTTTKEQNSYYDEQIEATKLAKKAMDKIKEYKINNGIAISSFDVYNCGLIGERYTEITTTSGLIDAKRTSCNPNFAALIVEFFREANIKEGDEVAVVTSGSFPALNICVQAACQVMNLKVCNMASIGASSFGANNPEFTYFDMAEYLYKEKIFSSKLDYVSLGGSNDTRTSFDLETINPIIERINDSDVTFLEESDYKKNIDERKKLIAKKCPNLKLFINVGGSLVSMGRDEYSFGNRYGLIKPSYLSRKIIDNYDKIGLLDTYLEAGVPVVQILNIKYLTTQYGIVYDPMEIPEVGEGDMYYQMSYRFDLPIIAIVISAGIFIYFGIEKYINWRKKK